MSLTFTTPVDATEEREAAVEFFAAAADFLGAAHTSFLMENLDAAQRSLELAAYYRDCARAALRRASPVIARIQAERSAAEIVEIDVLFADDEAAE